MLLNVCEWFRVLHALQLFSSSNLLISYIKESSTTRYFNYYSGDLVPFLAFVSLSTDENFAALSLTQLLCAYFRRNMERLLSIFNLIFFRR